MVVVIVNVTPAAAILGMIFRPVLHSERRLQGAENDLPIAIRFVRTICAVDLAHHERRDAMIVCDGDAYFVLDLPRNSRLVASQQRDQAILFLARGDIVGGSSQGVTVRARSGDVAVRHERENDETCDAGLPHRVGGERTVRLLLRGKPGETALDSGIGARPLFGR